MKTLFFLMVLCAAGCQAHEADTAVEPLHGLPFPVCGDDRTPTDAAQAFRASPDAACQDLGAVVAPTGTWWGDNCCDTCLRLEEWQRGVTAVMASGCGPGAEDEMYWAFGCQC